MKQPLVSIVTIVFNGEKHIEKAIQSVLHQTYPFIEYIIIDGASKDKTTDIIRKYQPQITKFISEPDNGIADAFNKGIKLATGELLGFVNADDWLESNAIETIVKKYEPQKIVYGNVRFWKDNKIVRESKSDHKRLREGMTMAHPGVYVPRIFYEEFGLFKDTFEIAMDYEILVRFYEKKIEFIKIDAVIVNMNLGGVGDKKWILAIREDLRVKNIYFHNKFANYYYFIKQFTYLFFERNFRKLHH